MAAVFTTSVAEITEDLIRARMLDACTISELGLKGNYRPRYHSSYTINPSFEETPFWKLQVWNFLGLPAVPFLLLANWLKR